MTPGPVAAVLGDPVGFLDEVLAGLTAVGIDTASQPLSHLGFKAPTFAAYEQVRDDLLVHADGIVENVHNERPIAKVALAEPLFLHGRQVCLVEVMPPKAGRPARRSGLEHVGFVVGAGLDDFVRDHDDAITNRQDQGPFCQPACVVLAGARRAKFYELGLRDVVEAEGHEFRRPL